METNVAGRVRLYLKIEMQFKEDLGSIRHLTHLKIAVEGNHMWVTNFDSGQFESLDIKSIPYKELFYSKNGQLYPFNSLLPCAGNAPLKWEPITTVLPIKLDRFNPNFFGVTERIDPLLIPSQTESEPTIMLCSLSDLKEYIESAPEIRLKNKKWVLLNNTKALLLGTPLLPIKGNVYEVQNDFIIPSGFQFELISIASIINQQINPTYQSWIVWNTDSTYFKVEKEKVQPLTLSSFRRSTHSLNLNK